MAHFRPILLAFAAALILSASALGQAVPDRVCSAEDIAAARAGTYTGPACRFSADSAPQPEPRLAGAPPRHPQPVAPAPVRMAAPGPVTGTPERVVLADDFFTGSLTGGVEQPVFRPVYAFRGLILIDASGRVQTGFAGANTTLTRQVRSLDAPVIPAPVIPAPVISAPVITPRRAYPYN